MAARRALPLVLLYLQLARLLLVLVLQQQVLEERQGWRKPVGARALFAP